MEIDEINKITKNDEKNANNETQENNYKPLFTRSRILFIISIFVVMLMPLIYRYFEYLLK